MPANLTPDYRKAEEAYRQARDPNEKLEHLREMLRTIPKHKGTDHLQGDIKKKIKELSEELQGPKKGAQRKGPVHVLRREGAAQVALIGPPNAGKSALHARLTGSRTDVGPYPYTTKEPIPGMLPYKDVLFQLRRFATAFKEARERQANESDTVMYLVRFFEDSDTDHVHVHNASRGCWAVRVDRAT